MRRIAFHNGVSSARDNDDRSAMACRTEIAGRARDVIASNEIWEDFLQSGAVGGKLGQYFSRIRSVQAALAQEKDSSQGGVRGSRKSGGHFPGDREEARGKGLVENQTVRYEGDQRFLEKQIPHCYYLVDG